MIVANLLPVGVSLEEMNVEKETITIKLRTSQIKAVCPRCNAESVHIHSRYIRIVKDLPCLGLEVKLSIKAKRYFCLNLGCNQQIFCERLKTVVKERGRFSIKLNQMMSFIALANGGELGAKLAARFNIKVSPNTLLNRIRAFNSPSTNLVRVLGVDDWAIRKGQRYGTILVDLESHRPIELLADRNSETLAKWLKDHPEVEIISRDRAGAYIDGANKGAPQAKQVADRFHLLKNLTETTERFLKARNNYIKLAVEEISKQSNQPQANEPIIDIAQTSSLEVKAFEQPKQDLKYEKYLEVKALYEKGASIRTIAKHFGMHRRTVRLWVNAQTYPERSKPADRSSMVDKYAKYLEKRWKEGCHNAAQLWRELKTQGFNGSQSNVRKYLTDYREDKPEHIKELANSKPKPEIPSTRQTAWLLGQKAKDIKAGQQAFIDKLCEVSSEIKVVYNLAQSFSTMVRERNLSALEQFLTDATNSKIKEFVNFAEGLRKEQASIEAALTLSWSNGQVEGQVNRLKLLKRQMFGRAKLDLLNQRVINRL